MPTAIEAGRPRKSGNDGKGWRRQPGKTPHTPMALWICGEQISDVQRLDGEMAHLRTSNTCTLQCSSHVSMSFKTKSRVNLHS